MLQKNLKFFIKICSGAYQLVVIVKTNNLILELLQNKIIKRVVAVFHEVVFFTNYNMFSKMKILKNYFACLLQVIRNVINVHPNACSH